MPKIVDRRLMQDTILDAAMRTFARKGYHAATIGDVALEAGLGKGTIYLYFKSKEAMTEAMADRHFTALSERWIDDGECATLDDFLGSLKSLADIHAEHARFIPVFFEIFGPSFASQAFAARVESFFDRLGRHFAARIAGLQDKGEIAPHHDSASLGRALAAMLDGLILHRGLFAISAKRQKAMIVEVMRLFENGLRPKQASPS